MVPDTFSIGVTAEEYRRIRITIEVEPVFFSECFVLKVGIVADLRSETGVIASDNVNALVPPVGKILRFVVFSCVDSKDEESASTAPAASNVFSYVCHCLKIPCGSEKGANCVSKYFVYRGAYYKNHCSQKYVSFHSSIIYVIDCVHVYTHSGGDCTDFRPCCKLLLSIQVM